MYSMKNDLLMKNILFKHRDKYGRTPLMFSVLGDHHECTDILLKVIFNYFNYKSLVTNAPPSRPCMQSFIESSHQGNMTENPSVLESKNLTQTQKHVQCKKSKILLQISWYLGNIPYSWASHSDKVSWLKDKNCEFLKMNIFLSLGQIFRDSL